MRRKTPGDKLFAHLNRPPVRRTRTPTTKTEIPTSASNFVVIRDSMTSEKAIESSLHALEADIEKWIEEADPTPIEILRKIAETKETHRSLFTFLADELERALNEREIAPDNKWKTMVEPRIMQLKAIEEEVLREGELKLALEEQLKQVTAQKTEAEKKCRAFEQALEGQTFNESMKHRTLSEQNKAMNDTDQTTDDVVLEIQDKRFTELTGQNRYLRHEIACLTAKLQEIKERRDVELRLWAQKVEAEGGYEQNVHLQTNLGGVT